MIKPASRKLLYQEVVQQIIETIKNEHWKPGEQIPGEIELANEFQVSRNVLREALKSLLLNDILTTKSGRGTFVSESALINIRKIELFDMMGDDSSINELIETRLIMEVELVNIATQRATKEELKELENIIEESKEAVRNETYSEDLGMKFHLFIAKIAKNRIMEGFWHSITDQLLAQRKLLILKHINNNELLREIEEHERIYKCMKDNKPQEAREAMYFHLSKAKDILEEDNKKQNSS